MATQDEPAKKTEKKKKKPSKPRPLWWRIVRGFLFTLLGIFVLALVGGTGGLIYLSTDAGKERLRALVQERLQQRVNGTVELASLDYELLGEVRLKGLKIRDEQGEEAIALDELRVLPAWGDLAGGKTIALDDLALKGLHVTLIKHEDGSSNLKKLFKKSEAEPEEGEKKPFEKRIELRKLSVEDIDFTVKSPDGTLVSVTDVGFSGHVDAMPSSKDASVVLSDLKLGLYLEKPQAQGGLKFGLRDLKTGVTVDLKGGKGTAKLDPLTADLSLTVPDKIDKAFPIGWEGISFEIGDGDMGLSLEKLALGAMSLASIEVKGHLADGSLEGDQRADIVGLRLDAAQLNKLLDKEILKSDVELEAHLTGTAATPQVDLAVRTKAGDAQITAKVDLTDKNDPKHDISLKLTNVDTAELLSSAVDAPPMKVASLEVRATGSGKEAPTLKTVTEINASGIVARGVTIDRVHLKGNVDGPKIAIDALEIDGLDQKATARGTFNRDSKEIDVTLDVEGDVGVALAKLKEAGIPISTNLPPGLVKLPKGALKVTAKGAVNGLLDVTAKADKLPLFGGRANIDARASILRGDKSKGEKPATVKGFDFSLSLDGVLLSNILALRGKRIPPALGFDTALSLRAKGKGTVEDPLVDATLTATTLREDKGDRARAVVTAHITKTQANVDIDVRDVAKKDDVILTGHARLPLTLDGEKKGVDRDRPVDVHLALAKRQMRDIVKYVPSLLLAGKPIPKHGEAELDVTLGGSLNRPAAKVHLYAGASVLTPDEPGPLQEVQLDVVLEPTDPKSVAYSAVADLAVRLEKGKDLIDGKLKATFPSSPLAGGADGVKYEGHFDLGPGWLRTLPDVPQFAKLRQWGGKITGDLDLQGNRNDLTATLQIEADNVGNMEKLLPPVVPTGLVTSTLPPGPARGLYDADIKIELKPDKTHIFVEGQLKDDRLVKLEGDIGIAGKGLIPRLKQGLDPSLDLTLEIPPRKLDTLASIRPLFEKAPGTISGNVRATGSVKKPYLSGSINVADVEMMDKSTGGAGIALLLDDEGLTADIGLGKSAAKESPILLTAKVSREDVFELLKPEGEIGVDVTMRADKVDIARITPKLAVEDTKVEPKGTLDWNMKLHLDLERDGGKTTLENSSLDGALVLAGTIPIPGTRRLYQDIKLGLRAAKDTIAIDGLHLEESDQEIKGRTLDLTGTITLDKLKPKQVDLALKSNKWLLFGAGTLGKADAPRGALTIDAKAHMELDRPIKVATVEVDKLAVEFPDRFEKAHQPEDLHVGDVVFLGQDGAPQLGKLPVPESVRKKAEADALAAAAAGTTLPDPSAPPAEPTPETGMDIDIHIAQGARVFQSPIDLTTGGDIQIEVRPTGRKIRGKLGMTKGELSLGGKMHPLREGYLLFDEEHPTGYVDLWFEKPMPPWTLRNVSEASAGTTLTIHTFGPLTDRKNVLSGAGSPGALYDLLSMHNVGRERSFTEADLPESVAVEFPNHQGLLALSFISVNLPHLLFLDRVAAWADPYDDHRAYGRLEHYEAERYFADGKGRVRAAKRPASVGRSEAEVEVDYLFMNNARTMFGIGGTAGSRGGGGPSVVFEWSSRD